MSGTTSASVVGAFEENSIEEATRMEQLLQLRLGYRIRDLRVSLEPHGVVITGSTDSYYDKQMAQHVAMKASGRGIAENRIQVYFKDGRPTSRPS